MRSTCFALGVALVAGGGISGLQAQQPNPHIGHVMTSFRPTPESQGLLPTAMAEAKVAAQHAGLAAGSPDNLGSIQRHAGHVLHAVDPSAEENGPGLGFGVKRAAEGVAQHIGLAAGTEGASANIKTHAQHVAASANTVVTRSNAIAELVQEIRAASSAAAAAPLAVRLKELADQLIAGHDANGDGRVGWQEGEGGLQQAEQHMQLMIKGEGGH